MVLTIVWLVGWVLAIWPMVRWVSIGLDVGDETPDRVMGVVMGALLALFWPAVLIGWLGWLASRSVWGRVLGDRARVDD